MASFFLDEQEGASRLTDVASAEPRPPSFGDQALYAGRRVVDAFNSASARIGEAGIGPALLGVADLGDSLDREDDFESFWNGLRERADEGIRDARTYRRSLTTQATPATTEASEVVFGLGEMLTLGTVGAVTGGGIGAAFSMGLGYANPSYADFRDEGVDEQTASGAALIEGGSLALMAGVPVSLPGRLATRMASGAAFNVGMGAGQRASLETYLRSNGYEEQAQRYRWNDSTALITDAVLGAAFGGVFGQAARTARRQGEPRAPDEGGAPDPLAPLRDGTYEPTPEVIDAALTLETERRARVDSAPGIPLDLEGEAKHAETMARVERQAIEGEPIDAGAWSEEDAARFAPHQDDYEAQQRIEEAVRDVLAEEGFADLARDVEALRARARNQGIELGDGDLLFSRRAERAPEADAWRSLIGTHPWINSPSRAQAVHMARQRNADGTSVYSTEQIAEATGYSSAATVKVTLSNARKAGVDVSPRIAAASDGLAERIVDILERGAREGVAVQAEQIAARTGTTVNTIKSTLSRVRSGKTKAVAPELRERLRAVNERMNEIRAREGRQIYPLASRGEGGFSSIDSLRAQLAEDFGSDWVALERAGIVEIVQSTKDLPVEQGIDLRGVKGVHVPKEGRTYLVADNVRPGEAKALLLHEIGVHHGLPKMLGERGFRAVIRQVDMLVKNEHPLALEARQAAEMGAFDKKDIPEETLAYLIEFAPDLPITKRILATIRQWLVKTFGSTFGLRLTVEDIRALALSAVRKTAADARRKVGPVDLADEIRAMRESVDEMEAEDEALLASAQREGYQGSDTGEAREWLEAKAKGLDLSQEARMKRAQEQGFDTGRVLYHGTGANVGAFDMDRAGSVLSGERAIYLSPSADEAGYYANRAATAPLRNRSARALVPVSLRAGGQGDVIVNPSRADLARITRNNGSVRYLQDEAGDVYIADGFTALHDDLASAAQSRGRLVNWQRESASAPADGRGGGMILRSGDAYKFHPQFTGQETRGTVEDFLWPRAGGANVMPVHLRTGRTRTVNINGDYDPARFGRIVGESRQQGYDTIVFKGVHEQGDDPLYPRSRLDQVAVLDPRNIRSIFAAFDPAKRDSSDLLASRAWSPDEMRARAYAESVKSYTYGGKRRFRVAIGEDAIVVSFDPDGPDAGDVETISWDWLANKRREDTQYRQRPEKTLSVQTEALLSAWAVTLRHVAERAPARLEFSGLTVAHIRTNLAIMRRFPLEGYSVHHLKDRLGERIQLVRDGLDVHSGQFPQGLVVRRLDDMRATVPLASRGAEPRRINLPAPFVGAADVLANPRSRDILQMLSDQRRMGMEESVRWGLTEDGELLIWDGNQATHGGVEEGAGSPFKATGEINDPLEVQPLFRWLARETNPQAEAYGKLDPVEQALADDPNMKLRTQDGEALAREVIAIADENAKRAAEMGKGFDAAMKCAIRHGGMLTAQAGRRAARDIVVGQGIGLAAAIPVGYGVAMGARAAANYEASPRNIFNRRRDALEQDMELGADGYIDAPVVEPPAQPEGPRRVDWNEPTMASEGYAGTAETAAGPAKVPPAPPGLGDE